MVEKSSSSIFIHTTVNTLFSKRSRLILVRSNHLAFLKKLYTVFLFLILINSSAAQLSGVVNEYYPVAKTLIANGFVRVVGNLTTSSLKKGDDVMIIQMKGAWFDSSNTQSFGTIDLTTKPDSLRLAGRYEFNSIDTITSATDLKMKWQLLYKYDPLSAVQLIKVPRFTNASITNTVTAKPWDGSVGGVVALIVDSLLRLNADIDASGTGLRGGSGGVQGFLSGDCGRLNYSYDSTSRFGRQKGESLGIVANSQFGGRGRLVNGGGGGNAVNAGGGGGSNHGEGGDGGNEVLGSVCASPDSNGGIGGQKLHIFYQQNSGRLFLGGGGGGGHQNESVGTAGGSGGGIIVLQAETISTSTPRSIRSNGSSVTSTAQSDGAGGGGAGGVILLHGTSFFGPINLEVMGGNGGDVDNKNAPQCHGPGGGGGGGVILYSKDTLPINVTKNFKGGRSGLTLNANSPCYQSSYGADSGAGGAWRPSTLRKASVPALRLRVDLGKDTLMCKGDTITLSTEKIPTYQYIWEEENGVANFVGSITSRSNSVRAVVNGNKRYKVRVIDDVTGIEDSAKKSVTMLAGPGVGISAIVTVCVGDSVRVGDSATGAKPLKFFWRAEGYATPPFLSDSTAMSPYSKTTSKITYYRQVLDANGCRKNDTFYVRVYGPTPLSRIIADRLTACDGDTITLDVELMGGLNYRQYRWSNGDTSRTTRVSKSGEYSCAVRFDTTCFSSLAPVTVVIKPRKELSISGDTVMCDNGKVLSLSANAGFESYEWQWLENGASTISTGASAQINQPGTYRLRVKDSAGCEQIVQKIVSTYSIDPPKVRSNGDVTGICRDDSVQLFVSGIFEKYKWSTGETTPFVTVKSPGGYRVELVTAEGCTVQTRYFPIKILDTPNTKILGQNSLCPNSIGSYRVLPDTSSDFVWSVLGGIPQTTVLGESIRVLWQSIGIGMVAVRGTNKQTGCKSYDTIRVVVDKSLTPSFSSSDILRLCIPDSVQAPAGYKSYEWSTGDKTSNIIIVKDTTFTLRLTVSDSSGCTGVSEPVTIIATSRPDPRIVGAHLCRNSPAVLSSQGTWSRYLWSTGDTSRSITVRDTGLYHLTVTNSNGCRDSSSFRVRHATLDVSGNVADAGIVRIGTKREFSVDHRNNTDDTLCISGFEIRPPGRRSEWLIETLEIAGGKLRINPRSAFSFNYAYSPTVNGTHTDTLLLHISCPCDTTLVILLNGVGVFDSDLSRVYSRDTSLSITSTSSIIPVQFFVAPTSLPSATGTVSMTITNNAEKIFLSATSLGNVTPTFSLGKSESCVLSTIATIKGGDNHLFNLVVHPLLGNSDTVHLNYSNGMFVGDQYSFDSLSNTKTIVSLTDFCESGGRRFVIDRNISLALSLVPLPFTDQLELGIKIRERGIHHLSIRSVDGSLVWQSSNDFDNSEQKQLSIPTSAWTNGVYFVELKSPTELLVLKALLLR